MSQPDDAQDTTQEQDQDDAPDQAQPDDRTQGGPGLTQPGPPSDPQNPTG
jgi:hypothetical protein